MARATLLGNLILWASQFAPARDRHGHFPGCYTTGCWATRCREALP
jgi:hypothetical protein